MGRSTFTSTDIVADIWTKSLGLPSTALESLRLVTHNGPVLASSFKIGQLAQGTIALSALTAALIHAHKTGLDTVPTVEVPWRHAAIEFMSEKLYSFDGKPTPSGWGPIGGLHKTSDGHVRVHDSFPNHRNGALELVGLKPGADRAEFAEKIRDWTSGDLETSALVHGQLAIYTLRSYKQWDVLPQAHALSNLPVRLTRVGPGPTGLPSRLFTPDTDKCLRGLRVIELSRVIAAPLAGRTLAAHGADVLWVTSPNLPDLPPVDRDLGRGKRTIQLDIKTLEGHEKLLSLIAEADVFIQGFRPGSIASHHNGSLSIEKVTALKPGIVYADLSAFGSEGPWSSYRGFDSLVQTCSGMNVSEAEHFDWGFNPEDVTETRVARPMPCQALDHGAGYLLAAGISAALYRRAVEGGSWRVEVSLAGVMKYLRSLGQYPGREGFEECVLSVTGIEDVEEEFMEERKTGFGTMKAVKHSARVESCDVGWDVMPKPLGSDEPVWL